MIDFGEVEYGALRPRHVVDRPFSRCAGIAARIELSAYSRARLGLNCGRHLARSERGAVGGHNAGWDSDSGILQ